MGCSTRNLYYYFIQDMMQDEPLLHGLFEKDRYVSVQLKNKSEDKIR